MKFNKGDIVEITGYTYAKTDYSYPARELYSFSAKPQKGILIGYSFLQTGNVTYSTYESQGYLTDNTFHKVWVVEPLTHGNRYIKPLRCLESQIEKI